MNEHTEILELGGLQIPITRKAIKHIHIAVYPPDGHVAVSAPLDKQREIIRAFVLAKLSWIKARQAEFAAQLRQAPLDYITRESHYLWGRRYLLVVQYGSHPKVELLPKKIVLTVKPGASPKEREKLMEAWQRSLLKAELALLIPKWESILGVAVHACFVQKLKTKWGSCTPAKGYVRFNINLAKKPKDLLEYVVIHELCHLLEPKHSEKFYTLLSRHCPNWQHARETLNALPL